MTPPAAKLGGGQLLRATAAGRIYELDAQREGEAVIHKVIETSPELAPWIGRQLELRAAVPVAGVGSTLSIEREGARITMVRARGAGRPLAALRGQAVAVGVALGIISQVAATTAGIHEQRIVHGDLCPRTIWIDGGVDGGAEEGSAPRVTLVDMGCPPLLQGAYGELDHPTILRESLAYRAPELIGRRFRSADPRSDLYAIGVMAYELLTGRLPFAGATMGELLRAHLQLVPRPVSALRPGLPTLVDAVVARLLDKLPERRYQSAASLSRDLDRIREATTALELEAEERPAIFVMPHELFGGSQRLESLEHELTEALDHRETRLIVLRGPAGVGKSALLSTFERRVVGRWGFLATGRYEARSYLRPYAGLADALGGLIGGVMMLREERRQEWASRLRARLGPVAAELGELVPSLGQLIGECGVLDARGVHEEPEQSGHRLALGVARMLECFAERGPLVLMLEQLEAADRGSVQLLGELLERGVGTSLLIVVSVGPEESLAALEAHLPASRRAEIALDGFDHSELEDMMSAALGRPPQELGDLLVFAERLGIRDFLGVGELLSLLVERGAMEWAPGGWSWTEASLAGADLPAGAEAMTRCFLGRATRGEREVLERAACIGYFFALAHLEGAGQDVAELSEALLALETKGILLAMGAGYRFANGRLHTVVLGQVSAERRRAVRQSLGVRLVEGLGRGAGEEGDGLEARLWAAPSQELFSLASLLGQGALEGGADLDALDGSRRARLGVVHSVAGRRSMALANWDCALHHVELARALLEPELSAARAGGGRRDLLVTTLFDQAELYGLCGQVERGLELFDALVAWELSTEEFGEAIARRVGLLSSVGREPEAVELSLQALAELGVPVPAPLTQVKMFWWVMRAWRATTRHGLDELGALPKAEGGRDVAAMTILAVVKRVAYAHDIELYVTMCAMHVWLGMRAGLHFTLPTAFAQLAVAVAAGGWNSKDAGSLCDRALELAAELGGPGAVAQTEAIGALMVWPNCRPWRWCAERIIPVKEALEESGDMLTASYAAAQGAVALFEAGLPLGELESVISEWLGQAHRAENSDSETVTRGVLAVADGLMNGVDEAPAASHMLTGTFVLDEVEQPMTTYSVTGLRALGIWLLGRHEEAFAELEAIAEDFDRMMLGSWEMPRVATLIAVCAGWRYEAAPPPERRMLRKRLRKCEGVARRWTKGSRENFGAMRVLIQAERERVGGHLERALARYEEAGELAHEFGLFAVELLARERLITLAQQLRRAATGQGALVLALHAAEQWGAEAVAARLRRVYGKRLVPLNLSLANPRSGPLTLASSAVSVAEVDGGSMAGFDLDLMLATSQLIAQALHFEEIVDSLLSVALSSTGAERGVLLLQREDELSFVAENSVRSRCRVFEEAVPIGEARGRLPTSAAELVFRTMEPLCVDDAGLDPRFASDPYVLEAGVRAIMGVPMFQHSEVYGVLMIESRVTESGFDPSGLDILRVFTGQAASAVDNARLYEALQSSEANWRTLVDGVPDMIAVLDLEGRLEFVNHLDPYDVDPASFVGMDSAAIMATAEGPSWTEVVQEVIATRERREIEVTLVAAGTRRYYSVRLAPIAVGGKVGKLISISTDITERKTAAARREELEAQLRQQQRLESLGTLASGVAHEINNPVQGIMNYSELISNNPQDQEMVQEFAGEITLESQRVATIVRDLLAFSRQEREQLQLEAGHVSALIESTLSLIRTVLRKDHIRLEVDIPTGLPKVSCRVQQIQQVLMNLVTNARDALNERYESFSDFKRIEIRARSFEQHESSWLRISVQDRGAGIPQEVQARIFDPFFTTKGRDQGTGLGLAVSHGIALEHGGELSFETEAGIGTVFHLDLPAVLD